MKKLFLVDVSAMFFRAFYAIPRLTTESGLPTNALYGFLSMSVKLLRESKPDYMVYCFDRKEPSFRLKLYPEYKANRSEMPEDLVPQMPYIRTLTKLLGIKDLDKENYEADDVIGTLAKYGEDKGLEVVIVSGDKDFAQLISPHITMYDTMKNIKYDTDGVIEKWGIHPEQMIDYLAIVGDSSDNIPGVKGIGPKGAQKLLAEYESLDGIYKNLDKITAKGTLKKLTENKEMAYLSKDLVTIATGVDLDINLNDYKLKPVEKDKLNEILTELEFQTFAKKLTGEVLPLKSSAVQSQFTKTNVESSSKKSKNQYVEVKFEVPKLEHAQWSAQKAADNIKPYSNIWITKNERGLCIGYENKAITIESDEEELGKALSGKMLNWKGFDLKKLWRQMKIEDPGTPAWDQMLAAYVVKAQNIDSFSKTYEEQTGKQTPDLASPEQILACELELEPYLKTKLEKVNGQSVFEKIEMALVPVLYDMEKRGIGISKEELAKQSKDLEMDLKALEEHIHSEAGEKFNIASPKQLGVILFEKLGVPRGKKTKTGYSTNSDVLMKLAGDFPICGQVLEYRELAKLKSTYVDALPRLIDPQTGRLHTHFRQAATSTGRLSSVNPNLQNIPIRTERGRRVRKAFLPTSGNFLLSVDYSQIELRVLAEITGDPGLVKAFKDGVDIHAATASEIFHVDIDEVSGDQRRMAKAVNFGIAYGQGAFGLSEALGIDRKEASGIIESYFQKFKKVKEYMLETVQIAKKQGYVETISGRRRYIDELKSSNGNIRKFGERAAINAPIQGTASDIVKMAMINVFNEISVPALLQVHDELLFTCPKDEVEYQSAEIRAVMEKCSIMSVPLLVNVAWGNNWDEAHA